MTDIILDSKEDLKLLDHFISKIKKLKSQFERENKHYEKKGASGLSLSQDKFITIMDELSDFYARFQQENFLARLSKEKLELFEKEHELFIETVKEYELNVRVATKIGDMIVEIAKSGVEANTKSDLGYNKDAMLMSGKKMIDNMPAVTVNSKV